jgi:hypothetical protein
VNILTLRFLFSSFRIIGGLFHILEFQSLVSCPTDNPINITIKQNEKNDIGNLMINRERDRQGAPPVYHIRPRWERKWYDDGFVK